MQLYDGKVYASPSNNTEVGRKILKENKNKKSSKFIATFLF
mgnify:CR=1 FL=1